MPKSDFVTFKIYNLVDQEVEILVNTFQTAGDHQITRAAEGFPSGIYFYRLQVGDFSETKKLLFAKVNCLSNCKLMANKAVAAYRRMVFQISIA